MSELDKWFPRSEDEVIAGSPAPSATASRMDIKARGENWTRTYMYKLCNIYIRKRSDAPIITPSGKEIRTYAGVDYHGSVKIPGFPLAARAEVEVKTFSEVFQFSEIKSHQATFLDESKERGELAMVSLVEHEAGQIVRGFWIPWPAKNKEGGYWHREGYGLGYEVSLKNLAWVRAQLKKRVSGNFKGKSLRPQDQDLLEDFLVEKVKNKWQLSETHWLRTLLCMPVEQPRLI
jgi:hypothetical protein